MDVCHRAAVCDSCARGLCRYVRMYEDPGEPESSLQPEWEIDPADLVIGVKARALHTPCPATLCAASTAMHPVQHAACSTSS